MRPKSNHGEAKREANPARGVYARLSDRQLADLLIDVEAIKQQLNDQGVEELAAAMSEFSDALSDALDRLCKKNNDLEVRCSKLEVAVAEANLKIRQLDLHRSTDVAGVPLLPSRTRRDLN